MSANNQILIANKDDRWYVFDNIMTENWSMKKDYVELKVTESVCNVMCYPDAYEVAMNIFNKDYYEYGIGINSLVKDGTKVKLI